MTPVQTILAYATLTAAICIAAPGRANDPEWNGDPEPPTVTPDPPAVTPQTRTDGSDRASVPAYWPCCIKAGEVVPLPNLLSPKATKRMCERAVKRSDAVILECPGAMSPEAVK